LLAAHAPHRRPSASPHFSRCSGRLAALHSRSGRRKLRDGFPPAKIPAPPPVTPTAGRVQARRQLPQPGACRLAGSSSSPERCGSIEGRRRQAQNAVAGGKEDSVRAIDCGLPRSIPSTRRRWSCAQTDKGTVETASRRCPVRLRPPS
jgi:hypothetical protein